jgi:AcrR family transcriptional regulator
VSDLRRRILDASVALVAEQGVRSMSFREVARRAGVSHQAPYHHFGSDLGILQEIAREGFRDLTQSMREAAVATSDPLEALTRAGIAYVVFAKGHVGHFRVMFQRQCPGDDAATALAEAEQTHQTLVELCAAARRAGAGQGLSAEALTTLSWSVVHGLATLLVEGTLTQKPSAADDGVVIRKTVRALKHLLANGDE